MNIPSLSVGDVHLLSLGSEDGITPKDGDARNKFFVVLGFADDGSVIGGVVINSRINPRLPSTITDYQYPISVSDCPFLSHNSFVNCAHLLRVSPRHFTSRSYRGRIDEPLLSSVTATVKECPAVSRALLRLFGLI